MNTAKYYNNGTKMVVTQLIEGETFGRQFSCIDELVHFIHSIKGFEKTLRATIVKNIWDAVNGNATGEKAQTRITAYGYKWSLTPKNEEPNYSFSWDERTMTIWDKR